MFINLNCQIMFEVQLECFYLSFEPSVQKVKEVLRS